MASATFCGVMVSPRDVFRWGWSSRRDRRTRARGRTASPTSFNTWRSKARGSSRRTSWRSCCAIWAFRPRQISTSSRASTSASTASSCPPAPLMRCRLMRCRPLWTCWPSGPAPSPSSLHAWSPSAGLCWKKSEAAVLRQRLARQTLNVLLRGTGTAARPSSSSWEGGVEKATPQELLGFYRAWYRPERMAVIAVGDFEPKRVEQAIRDRFALIAGSGAAPATAAPFAQLGHETSFAILPAPERKQSEKEAEEDDDEPEDRPQPIPTIVSIAFKRPRSPIRTVADLRQSVIGTVYGSLVQARLDKLAQRSGSPLMTANWFSVSTLPLHLAMVQAAVKPWRLEAALQTLWTELQAIAQKGFVASELAGALAALKPSPAALTSRAEVRDQMASVQGMAAHFLYGDALPSAGVTRDLEQKLLGQLVLSEINSFARSMRDDAARVVLVSGPKEHLRPEEALRAAVVRAESPERGSAPVGAIAGALVDVLPTPGSVVAETVIDEVGVTVWKLSNDATVVIKPTAFRRDEVPVSGVRGRGHVARVGSGLLVGELRSRDRHRRRPGRYEPEELGRLLAGRSAEAHPWISETEQGIRAKAEPQDLELMLQLVYLGFTAPRADPDSFEEVQDYLREQLRQRDADPNRAFNEIRRQQSFGNHPRRRSATTRIDRAAPPRRRPRLLSAALLAGLGVHLRARGRHRQGSTQTVGRTVPRQPSQRRSDRSQGEVARRRGAVRRRREADTRGGRGG